MRLILREYIHEHEHLLPHFTPYYIYDIEVDHHIVGTIVFRVGSIEEHYYDGHIGYTIEEEYRGHYFAYKACLLLKEKIPYDEVIITCNEDNIASRKTIEKLGATYIETKEVPKELKKVFNNETIKRIYKWEIK